MLRDVFYFGEKPNVHPRERHAIDVDDARQLATTYHFWIINEFCDYTGFDWDFDFDFLPDEDVWAEEHNNIWPSQHQKDSGTWLCPKDESQIRVYRADVTPIQRKNQLNKNWEILKPIQEDSFDFSWHPDPTDPPYVYVWGSKWAPAQQVPVLSYNVEGNDGTIKYVDQYVDLAIDMSKWEVLEDIEEDSFDFTWQPDPLETEPFIYVFGNQLYEGAIMPTLRYTVADATEIKYVDNIKPTLAHKPELFEHFEKIDTEAFDYSWRPNPTAPAYIYA